MDVGGETKTGKDKSQGVPPKTRAEDGKIQAKTNSKTVKDKATNDAQPSIIDHRKMDVGGET